MSKLSKREKVLLGVLAVVVVGLVGYLVYWSSSKPVATPVVTTTKTNSNKNVNANANSNANANTNSAKVLTIVDAGITWLTAPQAISDLALFQSGYGCEDMKYFKIANYDNGDEMDLATANCGPGGVQFFRFKKSSGSAKVPYAYLSAVSDVAAGETTGLFDANQVSIDSSANYFGVGSPAKLVTGKGVALSSSYPSTSFFSDLSSPKQVDSSSYGAIYSVQIKSDYTGINTEELYLKHADNTATFYNYTPPFFTDDNILNFTDKNGTKVKDSYQTTVVSVHCGSEAGTTLLTDVTITALQDFGTTSNGDKIYIPKNSTDKIYDLAYATYSSGRTDGVLSKAAFIAKNPILVWQDQYGDYRAFLNSNYTPLAECGKPVIYLYPQQTTKVSVKVDAKITKSDPIYQDGWTVTASPSGKLDFNGQIYDYLFWEGTGKYYPTINAGTVVKTSEAETTISQQLTKLGLNGQEKADFLAFWLPKMPKTAYVRLTWLGTREMNALAPLSISPKPDTLIRVFLDFKGLDNFVDIKPQSLSAPDRKGFTVVEWGGLLISQQ